MRSLLRFTAYAAAAAGIMIFFSATHPPEHNQLLSRYFDSGHTIVFGLLSWIGLAVWKDTTAKERTWEGYAVVFLAVAALGALTEVLQIVGPRRAEVIDVVRDMTGSAAFLLAAMTRERPRSWTRNFWMLGTAAVLLFAAFVPAFSLHAAYLWREQALPRLVDYGSPWSRSLWNSGEARVVLESPPVDFEGAFDTVARVTFLPAVYPRLTLAHPYPDWTRYHAFAFDVYSRQDSTQTIYLRIHDRLHREQLHDRYNGSFALHPGVNHIRIPLTEIENAPRTRLMDMTHIESLAVFAIRPPEPVTLWFSPFRLE